MIFFLFFIIFFTTETYASLRPIDHHLYQAAADDLNWHNRLSTLVNELNLVEIPEWAQDALFPACKRIRAIITCQIILYALNDADWHYLTHKTLATIDTAELKNMFELIIFNEEALLKLIYILIYYGEDFLKKEWLEKSVNQKRFDINNEYKIKKLFQDTPLHKAARRGNYDMVKWLVESCSAAVTVTDKNGNTPLHLAVFNDHVSVVEYLIGRHADINQENNGDQTSYNYACASGSQRMRELMFRTRIRMIESLPVEN